MTLTLIESNEVTNIADILDWIENFSRQTFPSLICDWKARTFGKYFICTTLYSYDVCRNVYPIDKSHNNDSMMQTANPVNEKLVREKLKFEFLLYNLLNHYIKSTAQRLRAHIIWDELYRRHKRLKWWRHVSIIAFLLIDFFPIELRKRLYERCARKM